MLRALQSRNAPNLVEKYKKTTTPAQTERGFLASTFASAVNGYGGRDLLFILQ